MSILIDTLNFNEGVMTSRPTIKPSIFISPISTFTGGVNGDIYKTRDILILDPGRYTVFIQNYKQPTAGITDISVVYEKTFSNIPRSSTSVGSIDLYGGSALDVVDVFKNIDIPEKSIISLQFTLNGKNILSAGFSMFFGEIKIYKQ